MSAAEREFDILMSEKEQADKQIGSYMELQLKVHTVIFTAAAVATGWIFIQNKDGRPPRKFAALQRSRLHTSGVCYSPRHNHFRYCLGYIRYKHLEVGRRMQNLPALKKVPDGHAGDFICA